MDFKDGREQRSRNDSDFEILKFKRLPGGDPVLEKTPSTSDLQSSEALVKRSRSRPENRCARRKTLLLNAEKMWVEGVYILPDALAMPTPVPEGL